MLLQDLESYNRLQTQPRLRAADRVAEGGLPVPDVLGMNAHDIRECPVAVVVAVGAGKSDDCDPHQAFCSTDTS